LAIALKVIWVVEIVFIEVFYVDKFEIICGASARYYISIAAASMRGSGGIGLAIDPADEDLVTFYAKYGFQKVDDHSLRMFLPIDSLC
jgi:hypothetical protein